MNERRPVQPTAIAATLLGLLLCLTVYRWQDLNTLGQDPIAEAAILASHEKIDALSSSEATIAAAAGQSIKRSDDGLFYVRAVVNGHPLRFIVDTGASVVVLTPEDARTIDLTPEETGYNANVQTVGGDTAMAWTTLHHVSVAGRDVIDIRAAVVRDGLKVSLLGQNALAKLGSLSITGDRLEFR